MVLVIHTRRINRGAARRGMGRGAGMGLGPRRSPSKSRSSTSLSDSRSRSNSRREPSPRPSLERQSEEETEPTEDKDSSHSSGSSKKADAVEAEPSVDYSPASPSTGSDIGNQALHDRIEMLEGQVVEVIDRCVQLERNQILAARSWRSKVADRVAYQRGSFRKCFGLIAEFFKEWYGRKPTVSFWHSHQTKRFEAWLEARYFPEDEP